MPRETGSPNLKAAGYTVLAKAFCYISIVWTLVLGGARTPLNASKEHLSTQARPSIFIKKHYEAWKCEQSQEKN